MTLAWSTGPARPNPHECGHVRARNGILCRKRGFGDDAIMRPNMIPKRAMALLTVLVALHSVGLGADLGAPNARGVSVGHVHLLVRDPEAHKRLWTLVGA